MSVCRCAAKSAVDCCCEEADWHKSSSNREELINRLLKAYGRKEHPSTRREIRECIAWIRTGVYL